MTLPYYVTTEKDGWSTVHGPDELELWRYAWEAQERADELNRRHAADGENAMGGNNAEG